MAGLLSAWRYGRGDMSSASTDLEGCALQDWGCHAGSGSGGGGRLHLSVHGAASLVQGCHLQRIHAFMRAGQRELHSSQIYPTSKKCSCCSLQAAVLINGNTAHAKCNGTQILDTFILL